MGEAEIQAFTVHVRKLVVAVVGIKDCWETLAVGAKYHMIPLL